MTPVATYNSDSASDLFPLTRRLTKRPIDRSGEDNTLEPFKAAGLLGSMFNPAFVPNLMPLTWHTGPGMPKFTKIYNGP